MVTMAGRCGLIAVVLAGCGAEAEQQVDVDAAIVVPTGNPIWARRGDGLGAARAVAADERGAAVAGLFRDRIDFGRGTISSAGEADVFVARFDREGAIVWSVGFGGSLDDTANAAAIDGAGNLIVTGAFQGEMQVGGRTLTSAGGNDVFLVSIDPTGAVTWATRFGTTGFDVAYGVAAAAAGEVVVMGVASGPLDVGGVLEGSGPTFLARFDEGGTFRSGRLLEPSSVNGVAIDADSGGVVIGGSFSGTLDLGTGPMVARASTDGFVARFDPAWRTVLAERIGEGSYMTVYAVAGDRGAVVSGGMVQSNGVSTALAAIDRHSAQGEVEWSRRLGTAEYAAANSLAIDGNGNIVVAGYMRDGSLDLGCGPLASPPDPASEFAGDMFLAKLDRAGLCLWSKAFGGSGNQFGAATAVDTTGNVLLAGDFEQAVDFGTGSLTATHSPEPCLAMFLP